MTDLKKRKTPTEAAYALFWDIIFFVSYQFIFVPEKKSRSTGPFFDSPYTKIYRQKIL